MNIYRNWLCRFSYLFNIHTQHLLKTKRLENEAYPGHFRYAISMSREQTISEVMLTDHGALKRDENLL